MVNPWLALAHQAFRLNMDAASVIAARMTRLSSCDHQSVAECSRMIQEKVVAAFESQVAGAHAIATGRRGDVVARRMLAVYGKRVRANRRRLTR